MHSKIEQEGNARPSLTQPGDANANNREPLYRGKSSNIRSCERKAYDQTSSWY